MATPPAHNNSTTTTTTTTAKPQDPNNTPEKQKLSSSSAKIESLRSKSPAFVDPPFRRSSPQPQNPSSSSKADKSSRRSISRQRNSISTSNPSKQNYPGLLGLAVLARDRTTSAIASFAEPVLLRSRNSSNSLNRLSVLAPESNNISSISEVSDRSSDITVVETTERPIVSRRASTASTIRARSPDVQKPNNSLSKTVPLSQAYENTSADSPLPNVSLPPGNLNKMHQTSSRLLRMTDDERPFTRDFKDLFATLVVSLPLAPHRVRLTRIEHSFLSEEAINNLGSLKFSQSNRMPDPKDPSRIVTTTTTTTFSMAREMARSVCQRFLEARFIESGDGKQAKEFTLKGSVWQLTPKGVHVLDRFCSKNGIQQKHVSELVGSSKNTMQLVVLERDSTTDKLSSDRSTVEVLFRRFIGQKGPNIKSNPTQADSESLSEYKDGIAGVRMAAERKIGSNPPRIVKETFTGRSAADWLMDCTTVVDRRETNELAALFVEHDLIWCVHPDRSYIQANPTETKFQPTKVAIYQMTAKGRDVISMTPSHRGEDSEGHSGPAHRPGVSRDSNTQKLDKILNDAALRLLFRENLRDTHCEENLSFYLDVDEFLKSCKAAIKSVTPRPGKPPVQPSAANLDAIKETMASAYGIYNAFLAPGSPCELNIDHMLRNQLATRMTKAVGQDSAMIDSLKEVTRLFEEAQVSVFKLMASDSVPKFMKSAKYEQTLKMYDFDSASNSQPRYS